RRVPSTTPFPYTTLFRSGEEAQANLGSAGCPPSEAVATEMADQFDKADRPGRWQNTALMSGEARISRARWQSRRASKTRKQEIRSEEHTSELQSRFDLVC